MNDAEAMRLVVVGASSGLGRGLAIGLARRGHQVVLMARRRALIDDALVEAGPTASAVTCDVTEESSCRSAVDEAVGILGGVDGVVYCPAIGVLRPIEDLDMAAWRRAFETNVAGAAVFTAAALPYLAESTGVAAYLSTISASATAPWPGLASYTVTKAALDKLVEAWRAEHPEVGFTRVVVGECAGGDGVSASQFLSEFEPDLLMRYYPAWLSRGLMGGTVFEPGELVHMLDAVLRCGASAAIPSIAVVPRQGATAVSVSDLQGPV